MWRAIVFLACVAVTEVLCQRDQRCKPNEITDVDACLAGIREAATDPTRFWFGTLLQAEECPSRRILNTLECGDDVQPQTLAALLFPGQDADLSSLDRVMEVEIVSEPGTYTGCSTTAEITTPFQFSLDPLSRTSVGNWYLRNLPSVSWPAEEGELYTLAIVSAFTGDLQALVFNIPGNDQLSGEAIKPYTCPFNPRAEASVLAFLLYKQSGPTSVVSGDGLDVAPFNLPLLATEHDLQGPVAMTWVLVGHDAYGVEIFKNTFDRNHCTSLISEAYGRHRILPFVPRNPPLYVNIGVQLSGPAVSLNCGSGTQEFPAVDVTLDPITNPVYSPAIVRDGVTFTVTLEMSSLLAENLRNFDGHSYTLIVVDPDALDTRELRGAAASSYPDVQGLIVNIENGDVAGGETVISYRAVVPELADDCRVHTYYILLYEQATPMDPDTPRTYGEGDDLTRGSLDIDRFVSEQDLTLAGMTWFTLTVDDYARCVLEAAVVEPEK